MNILFLAALGLIIIFFGALTVSAGERQTSPPQKTVRNRTRSARCPRILPYANPTDRSTTRR
jgi:hypothetical protein